MRYHVRCEQSRSNSSALCFVQTFQLSTRRDQVNELRYVCLRVKVSFTRDLTSSYGNSSHSRSNGGDVQHLTFGDLSSFQAYSNFVRDEVNQIVGLRQRGIFQLRYSFPYSYGQAVRSFHS